MTVIRKRLTNGPEVLLRESHAAKVVTLQMWVRVGAADESPEEAGLAHVLEHMLFKGTARRRVGEIARDVERAGGYINAWTSHDETVFHITMASEFALKALDVLFDAILHSALDKEELERELDVILEEIRMGKDSPERVTTELLFRAMFARNPYGRPVIGTEATVGSFTRRIVERFYRKWYVPSNMLLVAVGDFDADDMATRMERMWKNSRRSKSPVRPIRQVETEQRAVRFIHETMPVSEVNLAIGFPIPGLCHEHVPALDMLAAILGQGVSSRLETRIRRTKGLANDIRSICFTPSDAGIFGVFASAPVEKIPQLIHAVACEIDQCAHMPFPYGEIEKARTLLLSEEIYAEETVDGVARRIGYYGLHANNPDYADWYSAKVATLDSEALESVAKRYLQSVRATFSLVIPDDLAMSTKKRKAVFKRNANGSISKPELRNTLLEKWRSGFSPARKQSDAGAAKKESITVHTLPSGDTVIVRWDPGARLVAARAAFLGGLRAEPAAMGGLSSLLSAGLTRGTTTRSAAEVAAQMDSLACSISGFAGRNTMGITGEFLTHNFARGFELMTDCLRNAAFDADEIKREKELIIEEIRSSVQNPEYQVFSRFQKALFGNHPYGRSMLGGEKSVAAITPGELRAFMNRSFTSPQMVLAVDGGISPGEVIDLLTRHMDFSKPKKATDARNIPWKMPTSPVQTLWDMEREQSHLVVGFPGTVMSDPDRFALDVLVEILGGHGGRLFSSIREKQGLAYSVSAMSFEGVEPGYVAMYAGTSPDRERRVFAAMMNEIDRLLQVSVGSREFDRVVQHIVGGRAIGRQRASSRAAGMALGHLYGIGFDADAQYADAIKTVCAADVTRVAQRFFQLHKRVVSCAGPRVSAHTFT